MRRGLEPLDHFDEFRGAFDIVASPEDFTFCGALPCQRQREDWGWGTVKELAPYLEWVRRYTDAGDRVIIPCAGTAPAAIAAEREYGEAADVLAVDVEPEARAAWDRRRADELEYQAGLEKFAAY